jgi:acylphosphatase
MSDAEASTAARAEIRVTGRVQGVGYRDFVRRCAERAGVTGYTMNLGDGSVRVVVEGMRGLLEALIGELGHGPRLARVERVDVAWTAARGEFAEFSIRHGGGRDA